MPAGAGSQSIELLDADGVRRAVDSLAKRLRGAPIAAKLCFIGVRSRGVPLARRLAALIDPNAPVGAVDITLYRDDLAQAAHWPVLRGTEIPYDVDGADVVLVDDVLFSGRTIRAALNAICDLGRPARIRLAVLVDRGHRELPIQPDAAALVVATDAGDHVQVRLIETDGVDDVARTIAS